MISPASKFIRDMRELFLDTGLNLDLGKQGPPDDRLRPLRAGAKVVLDPGVQQLLDPRGNRESGPSPDFCEIFVLLSRAQPDTRQRIAVRAGDHRIGVLADADSGAFQAFVDQRSQRDRPVITEAFRDRGPDNSWRLTVYTPSTAG